MGSVLATTFKKIAPSCSGKSSLELSQEPREPRINYFEHEKPVLVRSGKSVREAYRPFPPQGSLGIKRRPHKLSRRCDR